MKSRLLIAIAALVACSGAWAEDLWKPDIDSEYWLRLGKCSGLHAAGDSVADDEGALRIGRARHSEIEKVQGAENVFFAGLHFGQGQLSKALFYSDKAKTGNPDFLEEYRQRELQDLGCRWIR